MYTLELLHLALQEIVVPPEPIITRLHSIQGLFLSLSDILHLLVFQGQLLEFVFELVEGFRRLLEVDRGE
jgi:hypothetical protein